MWADQGEECEFAIKQDAKWFSEHERCDSENAAPKNCLDDGLIHLRTPFFAIHVQTRASLPNYVAKKKSSGAHKNK